MKVLFWISRFPTFSETFIRDQIIALLEEDLEVLIYTKQGSLNLDEIDALNGYESYLLQQRVVNLDEHFEINKFHRIFKIFPIIFNSIFKGHLKFYIKTFNSKKFGKQSKSLRLFYQVNFLLKNKIDVIHAHYGPNGNNAAIFRKIGLRIKLFTTFHGYDIRAGITKGGYIYKDLFKYSSGVISISEYNLHNLLNFGAVNSKIFSITNGIDVDFYTRLQPVLYSNKTKILTVARLVEEKALDISIKAIGQLLIEKPLLDLEYFIIGEGEKRDELNSLINKLGLHEKIFLLGSKNSIEVRDIMHNTDLFILSSKLESLPTVLLEAQASSLIVLATDVGDIRKIVKGGFVVPANDIIKFKNGLIKLIESKKLWIEISNKGRGYVAEKHDIKKQTKKLISLYTKKIYDESY